MGKHNLLQESRREQTHKATRLHSQMVLEAERMVSKLRVSLLF